MIQMTPEDRARLRYAKDLLENPGLAVKLTNVIGQPLEKSLASLPDKLAARIRTITHKSLQLALDAAVKTFPRAGGKPSRDRLHKCLVAASGGVGGFFGLPALVIELPATTVVISRSIADIARSEGEDIRSIETRLACLEVFALGGVSGKDDAAENGYLAVRALLAKQVKEATKYIIEKGIVEEGAPVLVRPIATIASRFGVTVSQKAAAAAVPVIGAAGGALINSIFIAHFQNMARGHFIIRGLERKYGEKVVNEMYQL